MSRIQDLAVGAVAVASLFAASEVSAFAESRHPVGTNVELARRGDHHDYSRDRQVFEGTVRSVAREGSRFQIILEGHRQPFLVHASELRGRERRELSVGDFVTLRGFYAGRGYIEVTDLDLGRRSGGDRRDDRDDSTLRGTVEDVDRRSGTVEVREYRSGRRVIVIVGTRARRGGRGIDFEDLRRGDQVAFEGEWLRGGTFRAEKIDGVRSR